MTDAKLKRPKGKREEEKATWRLTFTVEVYADNEAEATEIARNIYEDAAKPLRELEGVRWLLPVADVKRREDPIS